MHTNNLNYINPYNFCLHIVRQQNPHLSEENVVKEAHKMLNFVQQFSEKNNSGELISFLSNVTGETKENTSQEVLYLTKKINLLKREENSDIDPLMQKEPNNYILKNFDPSILNKKLEEWKEKVCKSCGQKNKMIEDQTSLLKTCSKCVSGKRTHVDR